MIKKLLDVDNPISTRWWFEAIVAICMGYNLGGFLGSLYKVPTNYVDQFYYGALVLMGAASLWFINETRKTVQRTKALRAEMAKRMAAGAAAWGMTIEKE